jgi:xylulokinase
MNEMASGIAEGSEGLTILPFGNGAERVLGNKNPGASIHGLNLTRHQNKHLTRALQESIAFAFNYGFEVMQPLGLNLTVIRAGKANMFLSPLFAQTLSNLTGARIELCNTNGAEGAARGAAIGAGFFKTPDEAFQNLKIQETIHPDPDSKIQSYYLNWKSLLEQMINK